MRVSKLIGLQGRLGASSIDGVSMVVTRRVGQCTSCIVRVLTLCALALLARPAQAATLGTGEGFGNVEVHGFASQGFVLTVHNDYPFEGTTDGSFEFAEVGINFTKPLTETLRMGLQLFAYDFGSGGSYDAQVDWFYLDYRFRDWLGLRAGRLKVPYGLYNEFRDADSAIVPALLPASVYPVQSRQVLYAYTGAELHGFARSQWFGALDYRLFGGAIYLDSEGLTPASVPFNVELNAPYAAGGRLIWETPLTGLRVGGSAQRVLLETTAFVPDIAPVEIENKTFLGVAFAEFAHSDLILTAEYSRWYTEQSSNNAAVSPSITSLSERTYAMASYRLTPWLQPAAYYGLLFPNVHNREGRENVQHDIAGILRFDINEHWLVKAEGHYMVGTAGLVNPLRLEERDLSTAAKHWAAFLLKTTAYF